MRHQHSSEGLRHLYCFLYNRRDGPCGVTGYGLAGVTPVFNIKPTVATASAEVAVAATGQFVRKELDGRDKSITEKK